MARYLCIVTDYCSYCRTYEVNSASAMKAAAEHGRAEAGETVTVITKRTHEILSRVVWDEQIGDYIHVTAPKYMEG